LLSLQQDLLIYDTSALPQVSFCTGTTKLSRKYPMPYAGPGPAPLVLVRHNFSIGHFFAVMDERRPDGIPMVCDWLVAVCR